QSLTETVNITVTPVNDPPLNTAPGMQLDRVNTALVFSGADGNELSTSDIDAGSGVMEVTLSVAHGTVTLGGDTSGLTNLTGNTTSTVDMMGTLAALNNALSSLTYVPNTNFTGTDTLTFTTNDEGNTGAGGPLSDSSSVTISVSGIVANPDSASTQEN